MKVMSIRPLAPPAGDRAAVRRSQAPKGGGGGGETKGRKAFSLLGALSSPRRSPLFPRSPRLMRSDLAAFKLLLLFSPRQGGGRPRVRSTRT